MLRRIGLAASAALVVAVVSGIITTILFAGPWQDVQSSTGNVTAQSGDVKALYICDVTGTPGSSTTDCPDVATSDDSGADEIIFAEVEGLTPGGQPTSWTVRLRNITTGVWDVVDVTFAATESLDAGNDCNTLPTAEYASVGWDTLDDHFSTIPGSPLIGSNGSSSVVHVQPAPNGYQDLRIDISLPASAELGCQGAAWDVNVLWTVQPH